MFWDSTGEDGERVRTERKREIVRECWRGLEMGRECVKRVERDDWKKGEERRKNEKNWEGRLGMEEK